MRVLPLIPFVLFAAGCAEPIDRSQTEEPPLPPVVETASSDEADALPAAAATIPAEFHGRWGLVAADCRSTLGDAKGLIDVSEESVRFYESTATPETVKANEGGTFRATYAFTGEGQEWSRDMQLALSEDGAQLVRSEFGEDALAEPLTYTKCETGDDDA